MCPPTKPNIYIAKKLKLVANLELLQCKTHLPQAPVSYILSSYNIILKVILYPTLFSEWHTDRYFHNAEFHPDSLQS